ncbi:MAG: glycosyltransferase family 2 protein [Elusimicrobiota bacterium]
MKPKTALRLVIPAYNEGKNLASLCERIRLSVKPLERPYELFIVNDGSVDDTEAVAKELSKAHPIKLLRHERNRGIAAVFLTGLRAALEGAAEDDAVFIIEGDGTSSPELLPRMLEALTPPCDVVIASRYVPGGSYKGFPVKRLLLSRGANLLLRWICPMAGVRDYTIFFRAYRAGPLRKAVSAYGDRFTSVGGFACNAEMLLRLRDHINAVREIPFEYDYARKKGKSGMRISDNLLSYARLFRIFHFERRRA